MLNPVPVSSLCPQLLSTPLGGGWGVGSVAKTLTPAFQAQTLVKRKVGRSVPTAPKVPSRPMKSECRAMQSLRVFGLTAHLTDEETEA